MARSGILISPFLKVYVKVLTFKEMTFGGDVFRRWCTQEDITFMTEGRTLKDLRELSDLFYYMRHSKSVHPWTIKWDLIWQRPCQHLSLGSFNVQSCETQIMSSSQYFLVVAPEWIKDNYFTVVDQLAIHVGYNFYINLHVWNWTAIFLCSVLPWKLQYSVL